MNFFVIMSVYYKEKPSYLNQSFKLLLTEKSDFEL